ncbi:MAG: O-antigen translocase [Ferruginibacter sp.]
MNLIKTSLYTSVSQALSILAGLIAIKVISSKIGPGGIAMTGQFSNTTALLTLFASGAIGVGIVKYLAEFKDDKEMQFKVIRTAFWIIVTCSLIIGVSVILASDFFSIKAFKTNEYKLVYIFWGSFLIISTISSLLNSILNGLKLIKYLTIINIATTIIGLIITILMAHFYGVIGVLISTNFTSLALLLLHFYFIKKYKWFSFRDLFKGFDKKVLRLFYGFILMTLVSGILIPAIQLIVRNKIIADSSFLDAGYWQSVTRISDYYLGFVTSVLAIYYLPRLAEIDNKTELQKEITNGYILILPAVGIISLIIWVCRFPIIKILLTEEFLPSESLFGFQFLGDFFKIASWLLAYLMLARGLKITFIISEILYSVIYVLLCFAFMKYYGVVGAVYGFCASYFLYLIAMYIILKKQRII